KVALHHINDTKFNIQRRSDPQKLLQRRKAFRANLPKILVDNVIMDGISGRQSEYVWNVLKPTNEPVSLSQLKSSYFHLVADENIKSLYPTLKYNDSTSMFDLHLHISR